MLMRLSFGLLAALSLTTLGLAASNGESAAPVSCASLASVRLPDTTISTAEQVPGPTFTPPGSSALSNLPAFCRVVATTKRAVNFEVWLPMANWNGKFQGVGNGGSAGSISYAAMATALRRGYSVASTDTGHVNTKGFDADWAIGRPDVVADFGHRGLHVTTDNAKKVTAAFYATPPSHAYYVGCSTGGRQGLMEAQKYPGDYDGLIAGDPANNWNRFYAGAHLWTAMALSRYPDSYIPASQVPILTRAVDEACDALDGLKDGVIDDPRACTFDPATLACKPGQDPQGCFTPHQVRAITDIWTGAKNAKGEVVYPPFLPGAESGPGGWASWTVGKAPFTSSHWQAAENTYKFMVFDKPDWDYKTFDFDKDLAFAIKKLGADFDAVDPNLAPLKQRGGKLIVYHGWNDPAISPLNTINYYESVQKAMGNTQDFFRLFMVPGMQHCAGGPGPNTFDMLTALEDWVEKGVAPERVVASHVTDGKTDRTRPLCVYPKKAVYTGSGSIDDERNFICK